MDIDTGSIAQRFRKTIPVAVPLIDSMLRRAMRISIALELKAFNVDSKERTFYDQYYFRGKDVLFALSGLLAIGLSVVAIYLNVAKVEIFL